MRNVAVFLSVLFVFYLIPYPSFAFCFEEAGQEYNISPNILWAIAKGESDFNPTAVNYNKNGSYDYGLMQINSWWYGKLGHETWMSLSDPCMQVKAGAWVLAQCMQQYGYTWESVGCYNAVSRDKRKVYVSKVYKIMSQHGLLQK